MRRGALVAFAILGLVACGQKTDGGTPDVGAAGGAEVSPDVQTCLEMVTQQNWSEATRLCSLASNADPNNEEVKAALATANAALAGAPEASDEAQKAKDALPH